MAGTKNDLKAKWCSNLQSAHKRTNMHETVTTLQRCDVIGSKHKTSKEELFFLPENLDKPFF